MADVAELTARRLRAVVAAEQAAARLPSLVAGVVRDGALVWTGTHGSATGGEPPTANLQYRIGSITKVMTAVLVLQLRDDGVLGLNDPLGRHLPEVAYADRTIRSLLSHSSGMHSEPAGPWWERSPGASFAELAAAVDDRTAPFEQGATFHYTNLAYGLLGELVARHRGRAWWDVVRERILDPLSMDRTTYLASPPAATGYSVHHFAGSLTEEPAQDTGAMAPAGQAWSTVEDLARFAAFLLDGNADVLTPSTLAEMRTPQAGSLGSGTTGAYGLGLRLVAGGSGTLHGHTGSMPGFLAGLFVDPVRRTAAVCLANGTTGMRTEGLPLELLEELERNEPTVVPAWSPVPAVPDQVAGVLGLWHWGNTAQAFSYDGRDVVVTALATGTVVGRFEPRDDGTFRGTVGYHHGEILEVVRRPDGLVSHLTCATFVYTRDPYDPRAPIPGGAPKTD